MAAKEKGHKVMPHQCMFSFRGEIVPNVLSQKLHPSAITILHLKGLVKLKKLRAILNILTSFSLFQPNSDEIR